MPLVLQPNVKASQINRNTVADISVKLGLARPLAEVLYTRGYDSVDKAAEFIASGNNSYKDPFKFKGMSEAIALIHKYIDEKQNITIYGDYDVDGVCSVAILLLTFKKLGIDVKYYIPDRHSEGYGLNANAIEEIAANKGLLITVDCGISSVNEVNIAKAAGLEIIVTDHHNLPEVLPDCTIIDPKQESDFGFDQLCGAGVAFKISQALLGMDSAEEFVDLAGIATIADIVPLVDENKLITKNGLLKINSNPREGLRELIIQSGREVGKISASDISFSISPRLNAAGRLERADIALDILLGNNIKDNIDRACFLNIRRQELEETVIEQAEQIALKSGQIRNRKVIVAGSELWDKGVIGIAAAKLVEKYHRPCLLFSVSDGVATGSGRSVEGINLYEALSSCSHRFIKYGGHSMAAGMSLNADELDDMANELNSYIESTADPKCFFPVAKYDARICLAEINPTLITQMQQLAPFGCGNPMPRFRVDHLRSTVCRTVGKNNDHLKVSFTDDATVMETMLFSYRNMGVKIINGFDYTLTGYPQVNVWNNVQNMNFIVSCAKRDRDYTVIDEYLVHHSDVLLYDFLKQIMYDDGKASDECQELDDWDELINTIDSFLSDDTTGTIVLCNHPNISKKISQHIFANHPRCDIDITETSNQTNGYNTLLIGYDVKDLNLDAFKNVVICDGCGYSQINYLLKEFPHLDIYAYFDKIDNYIKILDYNELDFSREMLGKAYLSIKKLCACGDTFDCKDTFFRNILGVSDICKYVAVDIFKELEFLSYSDVGGIFKVNFNFGTGQNPLTNSKIYLNLQKISSK